MRGTESEGAIAGETVATHRLMLRPADEADRQPIAGLSASPGIRQNLAATPGDRPGGMAFAVFDRQSGALVGASGYGPLTDSPAAIEIATWIGEEYWGHGFATEASQAIIDFVFGRRPADVLWCANRAGNGRARRVIEKCGFQFRGGGMTRAPLLQAAMPVERFALERRNWLSLKSWATPGTAPERQPHAA